MATTRVDEVAQLSFGRGQVGKRYPLTSEQQKIEFADELESHTLKLTNPNTADCGDERITIGLADGTRDPDVLLRRIVPQLFGGIGLSTTKALVAANAAVIRDTGNIWEAFLHVNELLEALGYENAGHEECGASAAVESSVAHSIPRELVTTAAGLLVPDDGRNGAALERIGSNKKSRLESGFYGGWDTGNHQQFLVDHYPQNFSYLKVDPEDHVTHGHNGSALYVITQEGYGFQKDGQAFGLTLPIMHELANKLGGSVQERRDILLGFVDDSLHVGASLVAEGFPVFAQAA